MQKITSEQFKAVIKLDPAWAYKRTGLVEITDYCDMKDSKITHLSPLLYFTGEGRWSASFFNCKSLKIAEGGFKWGVSFCDSGIEKIGDLSCRGPADFQNCKALKIAEGKFPRCVNFSGSGIEKIGDLSCEKNCRGFRLNVVGCPNLKSIPFTFKPKEVEADSELIKDLTETRAYIQKKREEIVEIEI